MERIGTAEIGTTGLRVTRLGLGGAGLGGLYSGVSRDAARETVHRSFDLGARYFDTAPLYGVGKSETSLGAGLKGLERGALVVSTKVGRVLEPSAAPRPRGHFANPDPFEPVFDYSRGGILRSLEDSLKRLQLDSVEIALMHDPDAGQSMWDDVDVEPPYFRQAMDEAYPTLQRLKSEGVLKAVGVGMNQWQALARFAGAADFDCFLLAGRYTLLDHSALPTLMPLCEEKRISLILGGPYNSGILASDLSAGATYFYDEAPSDVLHRARAIKAVCDRRDVPLKAAALQFGLAHPAVASTIPGGRSRKEVEENVRMVEYDIPHDLWDELKEEGLIPREAPTPSA